MTDLAALLPRLALLLDRLEGPGAVAPDWKSVRGARNGRVAWQFAREWAGKR